MISQRQLSLLKPPHTPRGDRHWQRKPPVPERVIHIQIADTLKRFSKPDRWQWTHIPAGEYRPKQTAGLLERMGVRPGWPDFILINWTGAVYFLEIKSRTGELSEHQQAFFQAMRARNIECRCARSYEQAIRILAGWGVVPITVSLAEAAL